MKVRNLGKLLSPRPMELFYRRIPTSTQACRHSEYDSFFFLGFCFELNSCLIHEYKHIRVFLASRVRQFCNTLALSHRYSVWSRNFRVRTKFLPFCFMYTRDVHASDRNIRMYSM